MSNYYVPGGSVFSSEDLKVSKLMGVCPHEADILNELGRIRQPASQAGGKKYPLGWASWNCNFCGSKMLSSKYCIGTKPSTQWVLNDEVGNEHLTHKGFVLLPNKKETVFQTSSSFWEKCSWNQVLFTAHVFLLSVMSPWSLAKQLTGSSLLSFTLCFNAPVRQTVWATFQNMPTLFLSKSAGLETDFALFKASVGEGRARRKTLC